MTLDLDFVRSQFPGLDDEEVFFENAGGSVPCRPVIETASRYLRDHMVQLGATHRRSVLATEAVEAGRHAAAKLVNASPDEVILNGSTTMNMAVLARALGPLFAEGDEVVVTNLDHEANIGAWRGLEARGVTVREWRLDPERHELTAAGLAEVLTDRTRLVCFTHCANVVGTLHDVRRFAEAIHAAGAWVCVDGVAHAPHRRVDVKALGVDAYALSLYKVYGPHAGLLYVREGLLAEATSQNHYFLGPEVGAYRWEPGHANHELTAALTGVVDYLEAVDAHHGGGEDGDAIDRAFDLFADHEAQLAERLLADLRAYPRVKLFGRPGSGRDERVPTITFTVDGMTSRAVVEATDAAGIAIRHGHFYARRAMEPFGIDDAEDGVVRVSMVHYNTLAEVDRLREVFRGVLR